MRQSLAGDALVWSAVIGAVDRDVGHARLLPGQELLAPVVGAALARGDPDFETDRLGIAPGRTDVTAQLVELRIGRGPRGMREHDPAVAPAGDPSQRCILVTAKPEGNSAPGWQRIDAGF